MKNIYSGSLKASSAFAVIFFICIVGLKAQVTTYTFTTCGATGSVGPTQAQITLAYSATNLSLTASTTANSGIQTFTVPTSGLYRIDAAGASGGNTNTTYNKVGGFGARLVGEYNLTAGDVLKIIVGERGTNGCGSAGGGGGSFVQRNGSIIHAAGGGGGATSDNNASNATLLTSGTTDNPSVSLGGTNGNGGLTCQNQVNNGGGGGGYLTDGQSGPTTPTGYGGLAFVNGGLGGGTNPTSNFMGGFGGGGSSTNCTCGGGGGGGYSGGAGGQQVGYCNANVQRAGGGGGGSLNTGINQVNSILIAQGDGTVIITALCNITLSSLINPICTGNSATITTNAISNYAWSNGNTGASIVVSPTVTTNYTLTAMSPSNCIASAVITVTVNTTPTVSAITSASVLCAGKPVVMTASGANTYAWSGGIVNGTVFNPTASSGYTVTGTNACGTSTAALSITVNPLPSITASVNNPTVCNGSSIILNGGGSVSGYTWSAGAPNNSAFIPPATTNYVVTGAGANGCTNTAVAGVTVLVTPTITPVVTPTAICFGGTSTLSAVGATGYSWTPGTALTAANVTVSPPASTTYTLFRTNGNCSSTSTINLVVNPLPLVNASGTPNQLCAGTGVNLLVFGAITYTWLPGGFTISNFTIFPNFSTTYSVTGSNGNCTTTAVVPITVNPTPTISISTSTTTICQGNSVTLTAGGALTYTWLPMNTNNTVETASPSATTLFTLSGTNSFGCSASQNQVVVVNPTPDMTLTSSAPFICVGQTAVLSIANPSNNVVYNWSTGSFGTSISANPSVTTTYFSAGTNTVTGCQNTNTIALSVYIATFVVSSPTAICKGQAATLSAAGQATTYSWTANGGVNSSSVSVSPVLNTTYYVTGTTGNCQSTQSVNVIVNPIPNVTAIASKIQICRFEVSAITGNGATSYSWSTGASTPTISFTLSLTTTYTLTGTDLNGCSKTTTVTQFVATCIGIENIESNGNMGLNVYPNPNNGNFIISSDVSITLYIVNAVGQVVSSLNLREDNKNEVTVSSLPNGIYFITGEANGLKVNKKIIVER